METENNDSRHENRFSQKQKPEWGGHFHLILLAIIMLVFFSIVLKLFFWDKRDRKDNAAELDPSKTFDTEPLDEILPLDSSDTGSHETDDDLYILFLGNGSLAEDKNSDTNMANIVKKKTGATVYNCAIPGSYVTLLRSSYRTSYPNDGLSLYFICTIFGMNNNQIVEQVKNDMDDITPETEQSLSLLQTIDYDKIDVICIYYDASDYLAQRTLHRDSYQYGAAEDEMRTSPTHFTGALRASLELIQTALPNTRIIVMSPTYAYAVDEEGNYSSSYLTDVLEIPLTEYFNMEQFVCSECRVSFVDNLYGTIYEEIADEYLLDNILLNPKGNELVADRFIYALNRFNDYDFSAYEETG